MTTCLISGISEEGPPARHLQPAVALPRPPVAPRAQARRTLQLRIPPQASAFGHSSLLRLAEECALGRESVSSAFAFGMLKAAQQPVEQAAPAVVQVATQ